MEEIEECQKNNDDNFELTFIPEINENSKKIVESLRINSILNLFNLISNESNVVDLMEFQCSSVRNQIKFTQHQILAIQYFIPYAIRKAKKLQFNEIPKTYEQTIKLIEKNYNKYPVLIEFDEKIHLFLTKDAFLETMKIYLQLPHSKKFPIPIKFDRNPNDCKNNNVPVEKKSNSNSKQNKTKIGPQMEKAINNYLKKKLSTKNISEKDILDDPECTFQPKLRKTLYNKYKKKLGINSITRNDECMNMLRKYLLLDNNDKDNEIESYFKSLQECTFQPNIEKFIKQGIPNEFYLKVKEIQQDDLNNDYIESKQMLFNNLNNNLDENQNQNQNHNQIQNEIENQDEIENQTEFEKIENEREKIIKKIIEQEWNKAVKIIFKNESNIKISNLTPIYEYDQIKKLDSNIQQKYSEIIQYEWQTREQGPIHDRDIRKKLNSKKDNESKSNINKKEITNNISKKKYIPPYKWEEDLRSEDKKYQIDITNKDQKDINIKLYDQIRWERYIRLKDRHIKSIPVSNIQVVDNIQQEDNYLRPTDIVTPVTVVGIRENIINYLETELEKPLPNLLEILNIN